METLTQFMEMNAHMPRSLQTKVELQMLTSVPTQIVSPQSSKPVMGMVQDGLLGSYRYTSPIARKKYTDIAPENKVEQEIVEIQKTAEQFQASAALNELGAVVDQAALEKQLTQSIDQNNANAFQAEQVVSPGGALYTMEEVMHMLLATNRYNGELPEPDIETPIMFWSAQTVISYILPQLTYTNGDVSKSAETRKSPSVSKDIKDAEEKCGKLAGDEVTDRGFAQATDRGESEATVRGKSEGDKSPVEAKAIPNETQNIAVKIMNGKMHQKSILSSSTVGKSAGSLIHVTWNDFGPETTRHFFDNLAQLANHWLLKGGFSVGFADIHIDKTLSEKNRTDLANEIDLIQKNFVDKVHLGKYTKESRQSIREQFEMDINIELNKARSKIESQTYDAVPADNRIHNMITCGSKGKKNNMGQIVAMLGQQDMEGARIPDYFYRRTLPHFYKDSIEPEAKGFIPDSFMVGLSPTNYWSHAQSGRIGVISTSIKTAETGYIQRKLIKVMEDDQVMVDGTVRNSMNLIIQFLYGDDSFDATYLESVGINPIVVPHGNVDTPSNMVSYYFSSFQLFAARFRWSDDEINQINTWIVVNPETINPEAIRKATDEEYAALSKMRDILRLEMYPHEIPEKMLLPVNFQRLIVNIVARMPSLLNKASDLTPIEIKMRVDELINSVKTDLSPYEMLREYCIRNLESAIRANLNSKYLIMLRVNRAQFEVIIQEVYQKITQAYVASGEMVGSISAQSIGEPTTQLTLNVFHQTGQGSAANVSRGVPRMKEIMDLSKNPKTPSYSLVINDWKLYMGVVDPGAKATGDSETAYKTEINQVKKNAKSVMDKLVYTNLKDLCQKVVILGYSPGGQEPTDPFERTIIEEAINSDTWKEMIRDQPQPDAADDGQDYAPGEIDNDSAIADETVDQLDQLDQVDTVDTVDTMDEDEEEAVDDEEDAVESDKDADTEEEVKDAGDAEDEVKDAGDAENAGDAEDEGENAGDADAKDEGEDAGDAEERQSVSTRSRQAEQPGGAAESNTSNNRPTYWIIHFKIKASGLVNQGSDGQLEKIYLALLEARTGIMAGGPGRSKWTDLKMFFNYSPSNDQNNLYFQVFVSDLGAKGSVDPIASLRLLTKKLENAQIRGVVGIEQAYCRESKPTLEQADGTLIPPTAPEYAEYKTSRNYRLIVDTNNSRDGGTYSLYQIFNMSEIDYTQAYSNNIQEIMTVLGIEAAREVIAREIYEVLDFAGTRINMRHITLLADVMTVQGYLVPVSRYGVNKSDSGPFARASFEETASQVSLASQFSSIDKNVSVTANIMLGQFIRAGTNSMGVLIDETILETVDPPEQNLEDIDYEIEYGRITRVDKETRYCQNPANFQFVFALA